MTQTNKRPGPRNAPRRPGPKPPAKSSGGGSWMGDVVRLAIGGLIVAALALALQVRWPNGFPLTVQGASGAVVRVSEIYSSGPLRINEIMTANRRTLVAEDGSTPDWLEIANVGSDAVDLAGYALAKTDSGSGTFIFPELRLEAGACVLVLADSRMRADAGETLHAPFRFSSAGDTLMLFNAAGVAIDTVNIPALSADCSYARTGASAWEVSSAPTPGLLNTPESQSAMREPSGDSPVVLNEIVASNKSVLKDENGEYYDYIELYNRSNETVDLTGWGLSDDAAQARKWSFPRVSIAPGEYLVVYASGLNRRDDPAYLHTNFSLSAEGEQAALTDAQGRMMDLVSFDLLKSDTAWARGADGSWGSAVPSPGSANS